jgi:hypothetical protein
MTARIQGEIDLSIQTNSIVHLEREDLTARDIDSLHDACTDYVTTQYGTEYWSDHWRIHVDCA